MQFCHAGNTDEQLAHVFPYAVEQSQRHPHGKRARRYPQQDPRQASANRREVRQQKHRQQREIAGEKRDCRHFDQWRCEKADGNQEGASDQADGDEAKDLGGCGLRGKPISIPG